MLGTLESFATSPIKESKTYLAAARFAGAMPSVVETAVLLFGGKVLALGCFALQACIANLIKALSLNTKP